jgi:transcriptional regulator with XRE-family HTH domain
MRRRTRDDERDAWTPNQLVARRITDARELRGWTQEQAAEELAPFLGMKWSPATFSIVERSIDGKRIRQFSADEIVALSRAFGVPVSFWFTPFPGDEHSSVRTPDAPDGASPQVMIEALIGSSEGFEIWANELLGWGSSVVVRVEEASAPDLSPIVESLARLRAEMAVLKHFGALEETKNGLSRVLAFLEDLTTIQNPDDEEEPNETTPQPKKDPSGKAKKG